MGHEPTSHRWGEIYEFNRTSYRECADPDCQGHQEWICVLDRWSETFETPSPRQRAGNGPKEEAAQTETR